MVVRSGQIYLTVSDDFARSAAVACQFNRGILNPDAWRISDMVEMPIPPELVHAPFQGGSGMRVLEGNVVDVAGRLLVVARAIINGGATANMGAVFEILDNAEKPLRLQFLQLYPIPGGQMKFSIQYDAPAQLFTEKAAKLRAAYAATFLNPATGVLAGWKSADGQLHDYWFTFVQGVAITSGLLDDQTANAVMDRLLAKMKEVGYTRFDIGLPGNLVPIKKGDYVYENTPPERTGEPRLDDGSDGFPYYENGGATGCWAYYTVKALYRLGRVRDARRILDPMLAGYARGEFQGFGTNGMSRDWRDWQGGCHGYEGLLVDNYHALLAVLDDVKAPPSSQVTK
jgi:hypothetical protein